MLFSRRRNDLAIAGLVAYAGVLVTALTLFVLNPFSRTEIEQARQVAAAIAAAGHRAGTVVIPSKIAGQCRRLAFDNITGALREGPAGLCNEDAGAGNSTQGRMSAIRDSFANH